LYQSVRRDSLTYDSLTYDSLTQRFTENKKSVYFINQDENVVDCCYWINFDHEKKNKYFLTLRLWEFTAFECNYLENR
jgi:hypothetical protein